MSKKSQNKFNFNKKTIILIILAVIAIGVLSATGIIDIKDIISQITGITAETTPTPSDDPLNINDVTPTEKPKSTPTPEPTNSTAKKYVFRNSSYLNQHYDKHGKDMGFASAKEYEQAASDVINNPKALHKTEKEDGDFIYYIVETNEFVVLSTDGYIRTYFLPDKGKAYYDKQ